MLYLSDQILFAGSSAFDAAVPALPAFNASQITSISFVMLFHSVFTGFCSSITALSGISFYFRSFQKRKLCQIENGYFVL